MSKRLATLATLTALAAVIGADAAAAASADGNRRPRVSAPDAAYRPGAVEPALTNPRRGSASKPDRATRNEGGRQ